MYGKKNLVSNPFVVKLEYGAANDSYWNYDRMVLQVEDISDYL